jgi:hypothetical protein
MLDSHDDQDGQMWFHCPMCRADWPYAKTYSFRGANHLMRQHWPVGYDGEAAIYNEDDFRQIYDAYMEEKKVHPVLMLPIRLMSRLFEIFLMETFVMLLATASRRNERRRFWPGSGYEPSRGRRLPGSVWPFRTNEFIRFFVRRIR